MSVQVIYQCDTCKKKSESGEDFYRVKVMVGRNTEYNAVVQSYIFPGDHRALLCCTDCFNKFGFQKIYSQTSYEAAVIPEENIEKVLTDFVRQIVEQTLENQ